jgi:uncharacterized protein (TIGR02453 family)
MKFFTPSFFEFFEGLSSNNNKPWFDEHRPIYEKEVKKPFSLFVQEMILRIHQEDPAVQIEPKDAIVRINKDIRFSKDKEPYKLHVGAMISAKGKKDKMFPGIYIELAADAIRFYGGCYFLDPIKLQALRSRISEYPEEFRSAYQEKDFKDLFGEIQGEKNKRIPAEFLEAAITEPFIANKQFYFGAELDKSLILSDNLADELMRYYRASRKLNDFFQEAFLE